MKTRKGKTDWTGWQEGVPNKPGVYWFDCGLGDRVREFTGGGGFEIAHCTGNGLPWITAHYGGGPLAMFYAPNLGLRPHFKKVERPTLDGWEWSNKFNRRGYAWVRKGNGPIGFALTLSDYNGPHGSVLYGPEDNYRECHGEWMRKDHGWLFQRVALPDLVKASMRDE